MRLYAAYANYNHNYNFNFNYIFICNYRPCGAAPRHGRSKRKILFLVGCAHGLVDKKTVYTAAALRAVLSFRYHGR